VGDRHVNHRATKEIFIPVTGGTDPHVLQGMSGYLVDTNADEADIQMMVPHDFGKLQELVVAVIPIAIAAASAAMGFRVQVNYAKPDELYTMHNRTRNDLTIAANQVATNKITEINIAPLLDLATLNAKDYLGIIFSRVDASGHNTNVMVMGARLKYQTQ